MKRIVLVEDDESIRESFQIIFKADDIEWISLESGERLISDEIEAPDLFILDKQLSGANGLDVCRFIKSNRKYKDVPVIMLSASMDIVKLANEAGADDAIEKPFTLKKIRETVLTYIR